jgi:hypothetical protein
MKPARFRSELLEGHKGCACEVPFDPGQRWGIARIALRPGRRGHRVRGTINGVPFESEVVPRMRRFWVLVEEPTRKRARLAVGDVADLALEPHIEE